MRSGTKIIRLSEAGQASFLLADIDEIFFQSSNTKVFACTEARRAFHNRWLLSYQQHDPDLFLIAVDSGGRAAGYLAGCLIDPAQSPRFSNNDYFSAFAALTVRYPAHLHVNCRFDARGQGLGTRLIAEFIGELRRRACPGVHVVTGRGARNVGFYNRNGFSEAGSWGKPGAEVVFLVRPLVGNHD